MATSKILRDVNNSINVPVFIIAAIIPQIFGFNGSVVDSIWKALIFLFFLLNTKLTLSKITIESFVYLFAYISSSVLTCVINSSITTMNLLDIILPAMLFYLFVEASLNQTFNKVDLITFLRIFVYFVFASCLYSIFVDYSTYINLDSLSLYSTISGISSVFDNKNSFGFFLLYGFLSALILWRITKKKRWLLYSCFFFFNELVVLSRTALFISAAIFILINLLDRRKLFSKILVILSVVFLAIIVVKSNTSISDFIERNLLKSKSLSDRASQWNSMIQLFNGTNLWFGYGKDLSYSMNYIYAGRRYFHNTYLYILSSGGILRMISFAYLIIMAGKKSVKALRNNLEYGIISICAVSTYLIYSMSESCVLNDTPAIAMTATAFTLVLPIMLLQISSYSNDYIALNDSGPT